MEYNTIEERITSNALAMADQFYILYSKDRPVNKSSFLPGGKFFKYFRNTAEMFSSREDFNPYMFIKCNFEKSGQLYPQQLPFEMRYEVYNEYKNIVKEDVGEEEILATELTNFLYILKKKNVESFFENKGNILKLITGQLNEYLHFLSFSKFFCELYEDYYEKLEKPVDLEIRRVYTLKYSRLVDLLKNKLEGDYIYG